MQLKVQKNPEAEQQDIVLASDCGKPISAPLKMGDWTYDEARMAELRDELDVWLAYDVAIAGHYKSSYKTLGKRPAVEKRAPGRPKGSKDKVARKRFQLQITWEYGGKKGPAGTHFAMLGNEVLHDTFNIAILVQQPNATSLTLQQGDGDDASLMTVVASQVQGTVQG